MPARGPLPGAAAAKRHQYNSLWANRKISILPAIFGTTESIHDEFLRLLFCTPEEVFRFSPSRAHPVLEGISKASRTDIRVWPSTITETPHFMNIDRLPDKAGRGPRANEWRKCVLFLRELYSYG